MKGHNEMKVNESMFSSVHFLIISITFFIQKNFSSTFHARSSAWRHPDRQPRDEIRLPDRRDVRRLGLLQGDRLCDRERDICGRPERFALRLRRVHPKILQT